MVQEFKGAQVAVGIEQACLVIRPVWPFYFAHGVERRAVFFPLLRCRHTHFVVGNGSEDFRQAIAAVFIEPLRFALVHKDEINGFFGIAGVRIGGNFGVIRMSAFATTKPFAIHQRVKGEGFDGLGLQRVAVGGQRRFRWQFGAHLCKQGDIALHQRNANHTL